MRGIICIMNFKNTITGIVVHGRKEGRKIGFPTANIQTKVDLKDLEQGVYASRVKVLGQWYISATSYGNAPVFDFWQVVLETHILDFDMDIYDQEVELELIEFIRPVMKFDGLASLIEQIVKDCENVRVLTKINKSVNIKE
jgi:riboflavin kinase / FMN adenylyltransferase